VKASAPLTTPVARGGNRTTLPRAGRLPPLGASSLLFNKDFPADDFVRRLAADHRLARKLGVAAGAVREATVREVLRYSDPEALHETSVAAFVISEKLGLAAEAEDVDGPFGELFVGLRQHPHGGAPGV